MSNVIKNIVERLKPDPRHTLRATLNGLTVELRAVSETPDDRSAADLFAAVGPWAGETTEEILAILAKARAQGGQRIVAEL